MYEQESADLIDMEINQENCTEDLFDGTRVVGGKCIIYHNTYYRQSRSIWRWNRISQFFFYLSIMRALEGPPLPPQPPPIVHSNILSSSVTEINGHHTHQCQRARLGVVKRDPIFVGKNATYLHVPSRGGLEPGKESERLACFCMTFVVVQLNKGCILDIMLN